MKVELEFWIGLGASALGESGTLGWRENDVLVVSHFGRAGEDRHSYVGVTLYGFYCEH